MTCLHCFEPMPGPDLWDAISGVQICSECETARTLDSDERREAAWAVEQKISVLQAALKEDE